MYSLSYLWAKFFKKIRGYAIINSIIDKTSRVESGSHIVNSCMGKYSYCGYDCQIINAEIGSFCSIADNVKMGGAEHIVDWVSTSCVFYKGRDSISVKFAEFERNINKRIKIGNDVWIGANVIIKNGCTIGDGCVIGMGAIVTKDLPPYAIAVGNPAKVLRYRFSNDIINRLLSSKWWLPNDENLKKLAYKIQNVEQFLKEIEKL